MPRISPIALGRRMLRIAPIALGAACCALTCVLGITPIALGRRMLRLGTGVEECDGSARAGGGEQFTAVEWQGHARTLVAPVRASQGRRGRGAAPAVRSRRGYFTRQSGLAPPFERRNST